LRAAGAVVSVSAFTARVTAELFNLAEASIEIIPNGIDIDLFPIAPVRESDRKVVLYAGTLVRKKGAFDIPRIFNLVHERIPEAHLVLVGHDAVDAAEGSTWERMKRLFSATALSRVDYLGPVPYTRMRQMLEDADVCMFPTWAEALPLSWMEAMASAKPIVASSIGWGPELIDDGVSGYLARPDDHARFAECIADLLLQPARCAAFGREARARVEKCFTADVVAGRSLSLYRRVLAHRADA
jgi:glycosyltransferase involved in cell wall biosynthesis